MWTKALMNYLWPFYVQSLVINNILSCMFLTFYINWIQKYLMQNVSMYAKRSFSLWLISSLTVNEKRFCRELEIEKCFLLTFWLSAFCCHYDGVNGKLSKTPIFIIMHYKEFTSLKGQWGSLLPSCLLISTASRSRDFQYTISIHASSADVIWMCRASFTMQ